MHNNSSSHNCTNPPTDFHSSLYAATYSILFVPGLLANSLALWVLCRFVCKKSKAVIFMINLAAADLAHVFSLPLRMYYYLNHRWPFGTFLCQVCFYLKYLNMYASIFFLTCISIQRYLFLLHPFKARDWKRRYDIAISAAGWVGVGAACLPLPILRSSESSSDTSTCFADLGMKQVTVGATVALVVVAEFAGFVVPLTLILYCTWKMRQSLQEFRTPLQPTSEKRKALHMILACAAVFFICFTPYHVNFPIFMMVKREAILDCAVRHRALYFHPISLCLASLNCCLDPILYYFTTSEFQERLLCCSSAAIWNRLTNHDSNGTASSAGERSEEGPKSKSILMAYFWTRQPHRFERDIMESPLSC